MSNATSWIWIPLVLGAAAAQTVRNGAQRNLTRMAGTLPATFVRFAYGLPFAALGLAVVSAVTAAALPSATTSFLAWVAVGAIAQLVATAFLLAAMERRSFIVAVTYSKTELLQVAVYSAVLIGDPVHRSTVVAIVVATAGLLLLSTKGSAQRGAEIGSWFSPAALLGLASGASFALSAVGYRAATLTLGDVPAWVAGPYALVWAQAMQTLLLGGYLLLRDLGGLRQVVRQWRVSTLAGFMGATASGLWMTAFAMRSATDVRAVGLAEVLFSYAASRRVFKEPVSGRELTAIGLLTAGIVVIAAPH